MTSFRKWRPTAMIAPKHHIISSDYAKAVPLTPSYEKDPPDMQMLMSNSYAKKWHQENKSFKSKLLEFKNENEVFLMRRYVLRGLNKKMNDLELKRRVPSRVKVGKKVPFAVRLLPPKEDPSQTAISKSEKTPVRAKSVVTVNLATSSSHHDKKVEIDDRSVQKPQEDFTELNRKLNELAKAGTHLHAEQVGRKLKLYRVKCKENHHHGCDCEVLHPDVCQM